MDQNPWQLATLGAIVTMIMPIILTALYQGRLNQRVDDLSIRANKQEDNLALVSKDIQNIAITLERIRTILEEDTRAHK